MTIYSYFKANTDSKYTEGKTTKKHPSARTMEPVTLSS